MGKPSLESVNFPIKCRGRDRFLCYRPGPGPFGAEGQTTIGGQKEQVRPNGQKVVAIFHREKAASGDLDGRGPVKREMAAPMAVSTWKTGGLSIPGVQGFGVDDHRQPDGLILWRQGLLKMTN